MKAIYSGDIKDIKKLLSLIAFIMMMNNTINYNTNVILHGEAEENDINSHKATLTEAMRIIDNIFEELLPYLPYTLKEKL